MSYSQALSRTNRSSLLSVTGQQIPWAGGGYFRFIPHPVYKRGMERIRSERDVIFYLHPWEIDPEQPRVTDVPWTSKLRHYRNLGETRHRLERLLADFEWEPIGPSV